LVAQGSNPEVTGYHHAHYGRSEADFDRVSSSSGVSAMIHYLYAGHFEKDRGVMKLEKRHRDGAPRPVVVRPLDPSTVQALLEEKGVQGGHIPEDWWLEIEEEGFVVCDRHTHSRDAIDFLRRLTAKTGCDLFYDGMIPISADELTFAWDEGNPENESRLSQR
jgi:hypothetical protein